MSESFIDRKQRRKMTWAVGSLFMLLVLAMVGGWLWSVLPGETVAVVPGPGPVPESPFLNTRSNVAYVGSQRCAVCHADIATSYGQKGMGQSALRISELEETDFPIAKADFVHTESGLRYQVFRDKRGMLHQESIVQRKGDKEPYAQTHVMDLVIGSGRLGRTYAFHRDGQVFQSPISWYRDRGWGMSPGYDSARHDHFSRSFVQECFSCHVDRVQVFSESVKRSDAVQHMDPIGCERCHGPGSLHAENPPLDLAEGDIDYTIVNPRHLSSALRDNVCEQCHLSGKSRVDVEGRNLLDFRPGLPLHYYKAVFVPVRDSESVGNVTGHVEDMVRSRCYSETRLWARDRQMSCTSCHDPHQAPESQAKRSFFRGRCLNCHKDSLTANRDGEAPSCSESSLVRQETEDDCMQCHMKSRTPQGFDHMPMVDHFVRVHRMEDQLSDFDDVSFDLVPYHEEVREWPVDVLQRYQAMAYFHAAPGKGKDQAYLSRYAIEMDRRLVPLVENAVRDFPQDAESWEVLSRITFQQGKPAASRQAARRAIILDPSRSEARLVLASIAFGLGDYQEAETHYLKLVQSDPFNGDVWLRLGRTRVRMGHDKSALEAFQNALKANPGDRQVYLDMGKQYIDIGQVEKGVEYLYTYRALDSSPADASEGMRSQNRQYVEALIEQHEKP